MNDLIFEKIDKIQIPVINQFYKAHYKKGLAKKSDWVFTIRLASSNQLVACAKIKHIEDQMLLTGVVCDPAFQHQGIASYLIKEIQTFIDEDSKPLYCFPYPHLEIFYLRLGFIQSTKAQQSIKSLHQTYTVNKPLLLLKYR